mmetsp:Transcript_86356/g.234186  ORF Transcript_86356/g.234186 Transcript_86356/m.234186 type:complete len:770 (+) Transcript_86356:62-2371(+)
MLPAIGRSTIRKKELTTSSQSSSYSSDASWQETPFQPEATSYDSINTEECLPAFQSEVGSQGRKVDHRDTRSTSEMSLPELSAVFSQPGHKPDAEERSERSCPVPGGERRSLIHAPASFRPNAPRPRPFGVQPPSQSREVADGAVALKPCAQWATKIAAMLQDSVWLVLRADRGCRWPSEVPQAPRGILILTELKLLETTREFVTQISERRPEMLLAVVLLDTPATAAEVEVILQAQYALNLAGADDVIGQPLGSEVQLRLSLAMGMQRAQRRALERQKSPQSVNKNDKEPELPKKEKVGTDLMFWSCVHRIFPGFPKIDPSSNPSGSSFRGVQVGRSVLEHKLGSGAFGVVYRADHRDSGEEEAVKIMDKTALSDLNRVCSLWREVQLLYKLQHPGIVKIKGITHMRHHIGIHMECAGSMHLLDYLYERGGRLELREVYDVGIQITEAVLHVHNLEIAHRDIKHENVVISSKSQHQGARATLIDFGLAAEIGSYSTEMRCGTMPYCSPEVLRGVRSGKVVGKDGMETEEQRRPDLRSADIWSLGVVILEMAGGLGLMRAIMQWPAIVEPSEDRALELEHAFGRADSLKSLLHGIVCGQMENVEVNDTELHPAEVMGCTRLLQLLNGQFEVDPSKRLKCQDLLRGMGTPQFNDPTTRHQRALVGGAFGTDPSPLEDKALANGRGRQHLNHIAFGSAPLQPLRTYVSHSDSDPGADQPATQVMPPSASRRTPDDPSHIFVGHASQQVSTTPRRTAAKSAVIAAVKEGLRW